MDEPDDVVVDVIGLHNEARTVELSVGPSYKSTWSKQELPFTSSCISSMLTDTVYNIMLSESIFCAALATKADQSTECVKLNDTNAKNASNNFNYFFGM